MSYIPPLYAVDPILKYIPKDKIIWCPFDEEWSAFYRRLKEEGYNVVRSSLKDGQDFFTYEPNKWDMIVSNPPIIIFVFLLLTRFFSHFHFFIEITSKSMSFPLAINHGYTDV